jgi:hypothetical protein
VKAVSATFVCCLRCYSVLIWHFFHCTCTALKYLRAALLQHSLAAHLSLPLVLLVQNMSSDAPAAAPVADAAAPAQHGVSVVEPAKASPENQEKVSIAQTHTHTQGTLEDVQWNGCGRRHAHDLNHERGSSFNGPLGTKPVARNARSH